MLHFQIFDKICSFPNIQPNENKKVDDIFKEPLISLRIIVIWLLFLFGCLFQESIELS